VVVNLVWDGPAAPEYPEFPGVKGLTGRAIRTRCTINVGDVTKAPDHLTALGNTKSEIIVPVFDEQRLAVVGTIDVESETPNAFCAEAQKLLENVLLLSSLYGRCELRLSAGTEIV
jgi:putative methionine-R-sulfoxide reductase with GAF domain